MGVIDALIHLISLFIPALVVGPLMAGLAKLMWQRRLRASRWTRLALWTAGTSSVVTLAGLAFFGHDGMMATYGAMVCASALTLQWVGFGMRA